MWLAEVEAVGDTRGDAHALVETLADTLEEEESVSDTRSDAQHWSTPSLIR